MKLNLVEAEAALRATNEFKGDKIRIVSDQPNDVLIVLWDASADVNVNNILLATSGCKSEMEFNDGTEEFKLTLS